MAPTDDPPDLSSENDFQVPKSGRRMPSARTSASVAKSKAKSNSRSRSKPVTRIVDDSDLSDADSNENADMGSDPVVENKGHSDNDEDMPDADSPDTPQPRARESRSGPSTASATTSAKSRARVKPAKNLPEDERSSLNPPPSQTTPTKSKNASKPRATKSTSNARKAAPKSPPAPAKPKSFVMAMYAGGKETEKLRIPFSHPQTPISEIRSTIATVLMEHGLGEVQAPDGSATGTADGHIEPERIRIVYMGKILNDLDRDGKPATLFMYNIKHTHTITIQVRPKGFIPLARDEQDLPAEMDVDGDVEEGGAGDVAVAVESGEGEGNGQVSGKWKRKAKVGEGESEGDGEVGGSTGDTRKGEGDDERGEDRKLAEQLQEEEERCDKCKKKPGRKCKECNCSICGVDEDSANCMLCDECQYWHHLKCLPDTPDESEWDSIKEQEEWYCPDCRNKNKVVNEVGGVGSKKAQSKGAQSAKRWGGGMATAGRSKISTVVKRDHIGPVPGIEVGQMWRYRVGVSEDGVHGPVVGGIAGTAKQGCRSIVLSGGYPEDEDNGDTFTYTGSGGRNLKEGNRRTKEQDSDQQLLKGNLSNWKKSRPIRVLRSSKMIKEATKKQRGIEYVPKEDGFRYDGIYKLVRYWPERNAKGFLCWRYEFRRDDPAPAPWTPEGQQRIKDLGLKKIDRGNGLGEKKQNRSKKGGRGVRLDFIYSFEGGDETGSKKRKADEDEDEEGSGVEEEANGASGVAASKKRKTGGTNSGKSADYDEGSAPVQKYKPPENVLALIAADVRDAKVWEDVLSFEVSNLKEFFEILEKEFECPVCFDMVNEPFMIPCGHNICKDCTSRGIKSAGKRECPLCKAPFDDEHKKVNHALVKVFGALRGAGSL
ncbi:hypothetical protein HDU93_002697 [Gonapodya sp. JEL0774]|nr:hypothetical protein HDU93_002697 [Gonapodya sp. JEL0774]